jgi:hypothetical protein
MIEGKKEIWLPVPSLPGVMASTWGRIILPDRKATMPHGGERRYIAKPRYGTVKKAHKNAAHSYRSSYSREFGNIKIHRAVCEAFHGPAPFTGAVVIHIDENPHNNQPENLKWGTQKENMNSPKLKEWHRTRTGDNNPFIKGVRLKAEQDAASRPINAR